MLVVLYLVVQVLSDLLFAGVLLRCVGCLADAREEQAAVGDAGGGVVRFVHLGSVGVRVAVVDAGLADELPGLGGHERDGGAELFQSQPAAQKNGSAASGKRTLSPAARRAIAEAARRRWAAAKRAGKNRL